MIPMRFWLFFKCILIFALTLSWLFFSWCGFFSRQKVLVVVGMVAMAFLLVSLINARRRGVVVFLLLLFYFMTALVVVISLAQDIQPILFARTLPTVNGP